MRYLGDISASLLIKAIRTLPADEQDAVLTWLLDRDRGQERPWSPAGAWGSFADLGPREPWPHPAAGRLLRRLAEGVSVDDLEGELAVSPDVMRGALRQVSKRFSGSRAALFAALADGRTIAEAARTLGTDEAELAVSLDPTDQLVGAVGRALVERSALPRPPLAPSVKGPLRTMPVRFPEAQYEELKRWCEEHEFPMAVVVRGLVERFLEGQAGPAR